MKDIRHKRSYRPSRAQARGSAAFTLLEMLTVIIIVGLLLSIGTPAVLRMQVIAMRNTSLATVNVIDGGCQLYWNDFNETYPPSNPEGARQVFNLLAHQYRVQDKGRTYGPYNGCETVDNDGNEFVDAFGYAILYYCWRRTSNSSPYQYFNDDNPTGPADITKYAKTDGTGKVRRRDFLLCSRGPDGKWPNEIVGNYDNEQKAFAQRDDITNFLQEN